VDVSEADDIFSSPLAAKVATQIAASTQQHHTQATQTMQTATKDEPPANYWFMNQPDEPAKDGFATFTDQSMTVTPGNDLPANMRKPVTLDSADEDLLSTIHKRRGHPDESFSHRRKIHPLDEATPSMTAPPDPAILNLAINNDRNIDSLAREAHKNDQHHARPADEDEVVISLH
jgi:hypothetical protein